MALPTYFLATSPTKKMLTIDEVEVLLLELVHEQHLLFPAAIFVDRARNEVRVLSASIPQDDVSHLY